jgi:hypothetical protein
MPAYFKDLFMTGYGVWENVYHGGKSDTFTTGRLDSHSSIFLLNGLG